MIWLRTFTAMCKRCTFACWVPGC